MNWENNFFLQEILNLIFSQHLWGRYRHTHRLVLPQRIVADKIVNSTFLSTNVSMMSKIRQSGLCKIQG